jgi:hypothetical protein
LEIFTRNLKLKNPGGIEWDLEMKDSYYITQDPDKNRTKILCSCQMIKTHI